MATIDEGSCPVVHTQARHNTGTTNEDWWPDKLNIDILKKYPAKGNPLGEDFNYKEAFNSLDYEALKQDLRELLTTPQDWWPADFGHYGPLMVRMAWHSAGTYRIFDGRGGAGEGMQRFAPLNSWPDNVLLDKARRLVWPIKQKYGQAISWADLMVLAGTVALEMMGVPVIGFAGGREDRWEPDDDVYWGNEKTWLTDDARYPGSENKSADDLDRPLGATEMGLIYVNPEGPGGNPDPIASGEEIIATFGRMGMDPDETVALIAGGHTFGKTHGAGPDSAVGPEPEAAPMEQMGLGWTSSYRSGKGVDTIGGGPEVTWTYHPTRWDSEFFHILFGYDWELMKSPYGAHQWRPTNNEGSDMVPEADLQGRREPRMLTSDIALREHPELRKWSLIFKEDQERFTKAFAEGWYKLTHRDMGPVSRYLGPEVPKEQFLWQDPVPAPTYILNDADVAILREKIANSGLSVSEMVTTAWASASTFRISDKRGGANGARIRLEPMVNWEVNNPEQLKKVLGVLGEIQSEFNQGAGEVSLADLIVLAGSVGVEKAAQAAGHSVTVPFTPGRTDATEEMTDQRDQAFLNQGHDGFRNYQSSATASVPAEYLLVDRANLLDLTPPEMTALVGGMRVIGTNWDNSDLGVLTDRKGQLTNDFFVNLLDIKYEWSAVDPVSAAFVAKDRATGETKWHATRNDLVFGSNSELRALAEVYASADGEERFINQFVEAWVKVMNADRYDVK